MSDNGVYVTRDELLSIISAAVNAAAEKTASAVRQAIKDSRAPASGSGKPGRPPNPIWGGRDRVSVCKIEGRSGNGFRFTESGMNPKKGMPGHRYDFVEGFLPRELSGPIHRKMLEAFEATFNAEPVPWGTDMRNSLVLRDVNDRDTYISATRARLKRAGDTNAETWRPRFADDSDSDHSDSDLVSDSDGSGSDHSDSDLVSDSDGSGSDGSDSGSDSGSDHSDSGSDSVPAKSDKRKGKGK